MCSKSKQLSSLVCYFSASAKMSGAGSEALFTIYLSSSQQCLMPARVLSLAEPSQLISLELFPDWPGAG